MNIEWVRIVSWHAVRTWTRAPGVAVTLCGLTARSQSSEKLPAGKSCESCLKIIARKVDD